jgi:rhodanese-related sulfurtransferase
LLGDAAAIAGLALAAVILGWALNGLRSAPLPLRYASPQERVEAAATRIRPAPPDVNPANPAREIGLDAFQAFATGRQGLVLDARPGVFYGEGHVPGALNMARDNFEADFARLRPALEKSRGRPVAIYCSGADCEDSDIVAGALSKLGYRDLLIFREGWEQWTAAGLPQEKAQ